MLLLLLRSHAGAAGAADDTVGTYGGIGLDEEDDELFDILTALFALEVFT